MLTWTNLSSSPPPRFQHMFAVYKSTSLYISALTLISSSFFFFGLLENKVYATVRFFFLTHEPVGQIKENLTKLEI